MADGGQVPRPFSPIAFKAASFVLFDAPYDATLETYAAELKRHNVSVVVRACDATYDHSKLQALGFEVHELASQDGDVPEKKSVETWLRICHAAFDQAQPKVIGVHCVAGLGRSPLLVCVALMEWGYGDAGKTIQYVRSKRPGSINLVQLKWLMDFKPRGKDCIIC